jgi:chromate transporter
MHQELVERRKWISEARFLHALNYCMLLPGPEAQQLATYVGWLLHRTWGGIVAGSLFVLPSIFVLWTLSYVYVLFGKVGWVAALFYGLKPAVLAIVAAAVMRIGSKALKNGIMWSLAVLAFVGIFVLKIPFPYHWRRGADRFDRRQVMACEVHRVKEHKGSGESTVIADNAESPSTPGHRLTRCEGMRGVFSSVVDSGDIARSVAGLGSHGL